ncbi:MAG: hypothetical protein WAZ77_15575 [Candidatus Nitrosopolaris sp.]
MVAVTIVLHKELSVLNITAVVENNNTTICNSIYEDEKVIALSEVMLRNDALNLV